MPKRAIKVPNRTTYRFGVGVNSLSGDATNLAVNGAATENEVAAGTVQTFEVSRVRTSEQLQTQLGVDVEASYGCASFGAGVEGRFKFAQDSAVSSSTLFMTVTTTIHLADMTIVEPQLDADAAKLIGNPEQFRTRYGNMFCHACKRGGIFVGLMRVETLDSRVADTIEASLAGSYGAFSAEAKMTWAQEVQKHNASAYCTLYSEGGPKLQLKDPTDPAELLQRANEWLSAMYDDPKKNGRVFEWVLSPIEIAEGPLPPNSADMDHAHDVLVYCAQRRAALWDQLNILTWILDHSTSYDLSGPVGPDVLRAELVNTQADLELLKACASNAIDYPKDAKLPSEYATANGKTFPVSEMPGPLPAALINDAEAESPDLAQRPPNLGALKVDLKFSNSKAESMALDVLRKNNDN